MAETELLSKKNVQVTTARVVIDGTTYAVKNISAVQLDKTRDKGLASGIFVLLLGAGAIGVSFLNDMMIGVLSGILLVIAGAALAVRTEQWTVWLQTNAGRVGALITSDGDLAARVKVALDQAIVGA